VAQTYDARSVEINPLVLTEENIVYAADCHLVIDDYAVFRHPELGIEVAREFDRPPTDLEKIAYQAEEGDYRGTFYFFQMAEKISKQDNYIGFHGAGGGGSMMSMDAVLDKGFKLANYCDTSGNPSASKVYRAAKIILSQPNIRGYFASGSGVASQEQYHSARGMVKAFHEEKLEIPGVIRLGGNYEEKAIEILQTYLKDIPAKVEGYGRDDSPEFCAQRLEELIKENKSLPHKVKPLAEPSLGPQSYNFETMTGKIFIDHQKCSGCKSKGCIEACSAQILKLEEEQPVLAISQEEAKKGKCTECLVCEIFCTFHEQKAVFIQLPIPGLKEYREKVIKDNNK
jgi:succinyl-CoA synthetase beta subunit